MVDVNAGDAVLRLEGLATLCEVFLNGQKILVSERMFETGDLAVHLHGGDELALCFRRWSRVLANLALGPAGVRK
ncbi:hypothetical protein GGI59_006427 [Rhizobium lentis]|uniref:Beta-mannosidase-like galactose-binding domain-containing protein n=1 Tax=Rhizobium lentis TaxID=1138194 RepID=A0A7W9CYP1_9HYPH|nr:hypothetical protein [Rhizobium lentis]MBB5553209.1 hypothetical protein [Rhizobium lentis]MBB5564718.1 hypothetical protein [Rhizobium lentis]MBB5571328.1 hypothetical protein [Rhizobium lentis]